MTTLPDNSGIRDNYIRGTVGDFLKNKIKNGSKLSIVSAYFTIYAFEQLKAELSSIEDLRFLFGEPSFLKTLDPDRDESQAFQIKDQKIDLSNQLQQSEVARACHDWIQEFVSVRSVKQGRLLHGKMYHIENGGVEDAIVGSSNFTVRGLGFGNSDHNNIELNLDVDSKRDRVDLKKWFDELWNDDELVEDVKDEVLSYLEQLYINNSPEFVYYKTLFHLFEEVIDKEDDLTDKFNKTIVDSAIWNALFDFQKDGVKGAITKIDQYNGCILADSVGLGKTYVALAVIKYFEQKNQRVLVLCPKKLEQNWTVYLANNNSALNPFLSDRFNYTVLAHTDLSRQSGIANGSDLSTFIWNNYDLVVIDESHNFRNNTEGKKDEDGNIIRKSRYQRLLEDVMQSGVKTKVLLLSATPVNNTLIDLRNQIYILTEGDDDAFDRTLGIDSLNSVINAAQRVFKEWSEGKGDRTQKALLEKFNTNFFKLLDSLTIARSRKHVKKYYASSLEAIGGFPKRLPPKSIYPQIDRSDRLPSYDQLNDQISNYSLSIFRPSAYLLPEFADKYDLSNARFEQFTQQSREYSLIGMMKVGFLKRLESSIHSFHLTLTRTETKITSLMAKIEDFKQRREEMSEFDDQEFENLIEDDDEFKGSFEVGKKLKFKLMHLDLDRWLEDLQLDLEQISDLAQKSKLVTPDLDGKLHELKDLIEDKIEAAAKPNGSGNKKILIFTAYTDTAEYLYQNLHECIRHELGLHVALVTGSGGNKTTLDKAGFNDILINFSPISKLRARLQNFPQDEQIDILIASDCISEGQNLQDCDTLINYDIHWNPVRVIQRFGRIDRIGSHNPAIQLINFWPTKDLDKYISLKTRVEARMALVDISATNDDNLLNTEVEELIEEDLKYREKQLKRMKDEILDLEEFNEGVSLTDFTLEDFRAQLTKYIESNRKKLTETPTGIFAVVPPPPEPEYATIKPGVIFCLKHLNKAKDGKTLNPIDPYYLIYLYNDGTARMNYAQPKQILEVFQLLCDSKTTPYEELCALFDQRTDMGKDLSVYNELLRRAFVNIEGMNRKKSITELIQGRGGVIPKANDLFNKNTDVELITWLVIMEDNNG